MSTVLTDDEIVAIVVNAGTAWPAPLPTVTVQSNDLLAARSRGMRSLAVRGLSIGDDGPSSDLTDPVLGAAGAASWATAYVAPASDLTLAGTSTYAFSTPNGSVVDFVSPEGVHRFETTSGEQSTKLLLAMAKNVFDRGFATPDAPARLLVGSSSGVHWVAVTQGVLEAGTISDGAFLIESTASLWDESLIAGALG